MELKVLDEADWQKWDAVITSSPHGTIFHTWKWLKIVEKNTHTDFYPLIAYQGTNIVAIYPVFLEKKGFINLALSPPPQAYLLYLGPVIVGYEEKKQDKKESIFLDLQIEFDRFLVNQLNCKYARIRLSPGLSDSRPLQWCGYSINPLFTYRTNLSDGIDRIWDRFDRKLRVSIHRATKEGVVVKVGGREDLLLIEKELSRRRTEQGIHSFDHSQYLLDLYDNFQENLKIFMAYYEGLLVGSLVALAFKDIMSLWIGTPKSELKSIYPNDLVQWEAMKWAGQNGFRWFESMDGGDNRRLTLYKSKWNPQLQIWYSAEKHSSTVYKIGEKILRKCLSYL